MLRMGDQNYTNIELFYIDGADGPSGVIVNERVIAERRCVVSFADPDGKSFDSRGCIEAGDSVVVSDWNGARSYALGDDVSRRVQLITAGAVRGCPHESP